jgi:hypothetical protein
VFLQSQQGRSDGDFFPGHIVPPFIGNPDKKAHRAPAVKGRAQRRKAPFIAIEAVP